MTPRNPWIVRFHPCKTVFAGLAAIILVVLIPVPSWSQNPFPAKISGIKMGATSMDTLIVLGTSVAYGYSLFHFIATLLGRSAGLPKVMFYDSSTVVITLVLLGKLLEAQAKQTASKALREITKLESQTAHKIMGKKTTTISTRAVILDDLLEIRPGERIPVDGIIIEGESVVDESMLTGESMPVTKSSRDELIAGTINGNGVLRMKVTAIGKDTVLAHIQKLVRDATNAKPDIARLADSVSAVFVPFVLLAALITAGIWIRLGLPIDALGKTIAVLVVACPCALGLATPMAVIAGVGRAAKGGVLIRTAHALERAGNAALVVFDKTGTITKGKPTVVDAYISSKQDVRAIITVESASEHPLGQALLVWAREHHISQKDKANNITAIPGKGIEGNVGTNRIYIGTIEYMQEQQVTIPKQFEKKLTSWNHQSYTIVSGAVDKTLVALFAIDDPLRNEAKQVIHLLQATHHTPILLTGDKESVAKAKAQQVGIEKVIAEVKPEQKATTITNLREKNAEPVFMVGDGINDAPALAASDVGIAIGSGSAIAKATADMTILANNLNRIPFMIILSKRVMRTIKQNLVWAFGYNIILIPIAAGALTPFHITLTPPMAAFAMAASSLSVVFNSLRLSRIKIPDTVA